jgi:hypothetical protein
MSKKHLLLCHFVHHETYTKALGMEPDTPLREASAKALLAACFMLGSCLKEATRSSETGVDFQWRLYGVIPQKTKLFITTAVRTAEPKQIHLYERLRIPTAMTKKSTVA